MQFKTAHARLLRYPLERPIGGSGLSAVDVLVVEISDSDGADGIGFSYCLGFGSKAVLAAAQELLAAFVLEKPCEEPQQLWQRINAALNRVGRGAHFLALAAVDLAAWDLYARRCGEPLGVALGGQARSVPVYGSGGFRPGMTGAQVVDIAARYRERGVSAIKLRASGKDVDGEQLRALRAAFPPSLGVMVDLNEKGDLQSAEWLTRICSEHDVIWLEEPVPSFDLDGYGRLAALGRVALAGGEHWQGSFESLVFVERKAVAYVQPDLAMAGGLTECLQIARHAASCGVQVAPHFLPSLFVHLAAAAPNVTWLEDFPLLEPLFIEPVTFDSNGMLTMPSCHGHGLRFDSEALRRYAVS